MSHAKRHYNDLANDERYRKVTREWVKENCPLVYLFAPSNEGKTTLLGSLFPSEGAGSHPVWSFKHDDYCKVLYIDGDNSGLTIEHFVADERLCDYRAFDAPADQLVAWMYRQIDAATKADCNAIVIEGLTSVHTRLVADELRRNPGATGNTLRRCYIGASTHCKGLIDAIRQVKQNRRAAGCGVPIIVTNNTKSQPTDPNAPDSPERHVPDWSKNLIEQAMRGSDAHIQLKRNGDTTQLITTKIADMHPYCKMRSADVANAVQSERNLNLPGLLTLWAATAHKKSKAVQKALDSKAQPSNTDTSEG